MSTPNFYNRNATRIYAVDVDTFTFGCPRNLKDNIASELMLYTSPGKCEPDELHSYPSHVFGYLEEYECFRVKWEDIEVGVRIYPLLRAGYYQGGNLDWFIEVRDVLNWALVDPEKILSSLDISEELRETSLRKISDWIEASESKLVEKVEKVFEKYSTPLRCVGVASNGEAFYRRDGETYVDNDTGEIQTRSEIEDYYNNNPEIKTSFDSVDDLISQSYTTA